MSAAPDKPKRKPLVRFLCGCLLEPRPGWPMDEQGFVVCPAHYERRMGWRSPLRDTFQFVPEDSVKVITIEAWNWSRDDYGNECEFWRRFGIDISTPRSRWIAPEHG